SGVFGQCVEGEGLLFLCLICKVLNQWTTYSLWQIQKPLYKLDLEWPKFPEEFTGQTFCVAVDHLQGLVYVGQVRNNKIKMFMEPLYFPKIYRNKLELKARSHWLTDAKRMHKGHSGRAKFWEWLLPLSPAPKSGENLHKQNGKERKRTDVGGM
uniref:Uncharacterized protein n=1 Tax=Laticauda laticaudata TaxID=8630 RepID=A0A8C5WP13_LATLA